MKQGHNNFNFSYLKNSKVNNSYIITNKNSKKEINKKLIIYNHDLVKNEIWKSQTSFLKKRKNDFYKTAVDNLDKKNLKNNNQKKIKIEINPEEQMEIENLKSEKKNMISENIDKENFKNNKEKNGILEKIQNHFNPENSLNSESEYKDFNLQSEDFNSMKEVLDLKDIENNQNNLEIEEEEKKTKNKIDFPKKTDKITLIPNKNLLKQMLIRNKNSFLETEIETEQFLQHNTTEQADEIIDQIFQDPYKSLNFSETLKSSKKLIFENSVKSTTSSIEEKPRYFTETISNLKTQKCYSCLKKGHSKKDCVLRNNCSYCLGNHKRVKCVHSIGCFTCLSKNHIKINCDKKKKVKCHRCGKIGHFRSKCEVMIFNEFSKGLKNEEGLEESRCLNCGGRGHFSCYSKKVGFRNSFYEYNQNYKMKRNMKRKRNYAQLERNMNFNYFGNHFKKNDKKKNYNHGKNYNKGKNYNQSKNYNQGRNYNKNKSCNSKRNFEKRGGYTNDIFRKSKDKFNNKMKHYKKVEKKKKIKKKKTSDNKTNVPKNNERVFRTKKQYKKSIRIRDLHASQRK